MTQYFPGFNFSPEQQKQFQMFQVAPAANPMAALVSHLMMADAGDMRTFNGPDYLGHPMNNIDLQSIGRLKNDPTNPNGQPLPSGGMRSPVQIPWEQLRNITTDPNGEQEFWIMPRPLM